MTTLQRLAADLLIAQVRHSGMYNQDLPTNVTTAFRLARIFLQQCNDKGNQL